MPRGRKPKNQVVVDSTVENTEVETKEIVRFAGETCINHLRGDDTCIFYAGESWSYNLAKEMLEQHLDEVELLMEDKVDKSLEIRIPFKCMQYIKWPSKRTLTDEQREAAKDRLAKAREAKKK